MGLGMFDTCDNSLMVYIFGPQKSRPFTQSVHSFVGAGFVAGILLAGPFLPEQKTQSGDVCPNTDINDTSPNNPGIFTDSPATVEEVKCTEFTVFLLYGLYGTAQFLIRLSKNSDRTKSAVKTSKIQQIIAKIFVSAPFLISEYFIMINLLNYY